MSVGYGSTEAVQTLTLCSEFIISSGGVNVGEANHTKAMMKKPVDESYWTIAYASRSPEGCSAFLRTKLASSPYAAWANSYFKYSKLILLEPVHLYDLSNLVVLSAGFLVAHGMPSWSVMPGLIRPCIWVHSHRLRIESAMTAQGGNSTIPIK